jgi:hypothetical protein
LWLPKKRRTFANANRDKNSNAIETTALNVGMKKQTTVLTKKRKGKELW